MPRVQECSGTLLFVQVGHGVAVVILVERVRILRECSVCWSRGVSSPGVTEAVLWLTCGRNGITGVNGLSPVFLLVSRASV